jgi:type I restriction enzyme S subunit
MGMPALRFEEFSGDWKDVPISDCLQLMTDFVANGSFESLRKNVSVFADIDFAYYVRLYDLRLGLGHSKQTYVDEKSFKFLKKSTLQSGDILVANIGANVGEVWQTPLLDKPATLAPNMILLKVSSSTNESYLFHYLKTELGEKEIKSTVSGSGQPKVNKTELKRVRVKLPPSLKEQTKIANFLTAVDEKITQLTQKHDLLTQYKKGVMQQIFSQELRFKDDDGRNFPEWEPSKLGEAVELIHGYQFRTTDFTSSGLAVIKIGNVINNDLNLTDLTYINSTRMTEFERFQIQQGDILMSLTGNIGRVVEVGELPFCVLQNYRVGKFVPNNKKTLTKKFVKYLLVSDYVFGKFGQLSNQSAQANFGKQDMDKIFVEIPSVPEQAKIADFLNAIDDKITNTKTQLRAVKQYKQGLLQQMFV